MNLKDRIKYGYSVARSTPGILDPIRDKNGDIAKLHVLGPKRTRKVVRCIQAERVAAIAASRPK